MNRLRFQRSARVYVAYLAIVFVAACGGGADTTTPPPPPAPASVTFEVDLIDVAITDRATGNAVSVDGLPVGSAEITVSP